MQYLTSLFLMFTSVLLFSQNLTEITNVSLEGVGSGDCDMADIDNDGDLDLIIMGSNNFGAATSHLYINDGTGSFQEKMNTNIPRVERGAVSFADVDRDGDQDLMISGISSSFRRICSLYKNDGDGNFSEVEELEMKGMQDCEQAFVDIDNDDDLDFIITGRDADFETAIFIYTNEGQGQFVEKKDSIFIAVYSANISISDIDNDDDNDIIMTGFTNNWAYSQLYLNDGLGNFVDGSGNAPFARTSTSFLETADLDNDGDDDILTSNSNGIQLYLNSGANQFELVMDSYFDEIRVNGYAELTDLDLDGDIDIIISGSDNQGSTTAKIYLNDGQAKFEKLEGSDFEGTKKGTMVSGDIDGDQDNDLLIVGESDSDWTTSRVYRNDFISSTENIFAATDLGFTLFPNPAKNSIRLKNKNNDDFTVEIIDNQCKIILTKTNRYSLDISGLNNGMFTLKITSLESNSFQVEVFVVQN